MRSLKILLGSCVFLQGVPAGAQTEAVNLECRGRAETIEYGDTDLLTGEEGVVRLRISGQTGVADVPRLIGGGNHASLQIKSIEASPSELKGKIWYGKIGNAKMRIDRLTGILSIRGPKGNFSGTCAPISEQSERKPLF